MKEKSKSEISIIGGADGPTSIFLSSNKIPLKIRIRNIIYKFRRRIVEKKVVAGEHTLPELVQYAKDRYNLIEINQSDKRYIEEQKNQKESLILQHKLDDAISMNFHLYEIRIGDNSLEIDVDYIWNTFGISYSGNKKVAKRFKKISKDLYLYYGVSEDDIKKKTERYLALVTTLSL